MQQSSATIKKVSMELGGNAPFIVFEDADLDAAVAGVLVSKYRNAGQPCVCANRLYVHAKVYDAFAPKLVAAVQAMPVGDGLQDGPPIGPLIDAQAVAKVQDPLAPPVATGPPLLPGRTAPPHGQGPHH